MLDLDQLLHHAVEQRASDIHLKVGAAKGSFTRSALAGGNPVPASSLPVI